MGQILNPAYIFLNVFGLTLIAKLQAERHIRKSGIDYTIIRPGGLKNEPPTGNLVMAAEVITFCLVCIDLCFYMIFRWLTESWGLFLGYSLWRKHIKRFSCRSSCWGIGSPGSVLQGCRNSFSRWCAEAFIWGSFWLHKAALVVFICYLILRILSVLISCFLAAVPHFKASLRYIQAAFHCIVMYWFC